MISSVVAGLDATLLSITSDMEAAQRHYDHLAMLHEGQIVWAGTIEEAIASDDPYLGQLLHGESKGPIQMRLRARAT